MTQRRRGIRRPTTWATTDTLSEAMQDMKPEHKVCRALRHTWDIKPNSYRHGRDGATVIITVWCTRCEAVEKDIEYTDRGEIIDRGGARYDRESNYLLDGVGRIGGDVQGLLFDAVVQERLKGEMNGKGSRRRRGAAE